MVKLIFFCRRRPDISRERYAELLLGGHVPLALRHHPAMQAYVVNLVEGNPAEGEELDSIGELFFASLDDFRQRLYDSPAGRAVIEHDVAGFLGGADAYATSEHVQKSTRPEPPAGTRTPGVKMVCPLRRRDGLSHAAFVDHWLGTHVPLALEHHPGLSRYVTNVVDEKLSPGGADWDGVAELHFDSAEDLSRRLFASAAAERAIRADMEKFIGQTYPYFVGEYVQKRGG
jgi:uncharacterized protein (TIGR02118 family)